MRTTLRLCLALPLAALTACSGNTPPPEAPPGARAEHHHDHAEGDDSHAHPHPHAHAHAHAHDHAGSVKAPGEATIGDTARCPVSGEEFVVTANSPKVEHEGKAYYFCCAGCEKKFKSDPAKFTAKPTS